MEFARRSGKARELDMTPLIDIVFLLVVFFMLTTSFIASESIELNLPSAASENPTPPTTIEPMRITIEENGNFKLDETELDSDSLEEALLDRLAREPETPIGIFTSPGVNVQELVSVMDMVYLAGGRKVKVDRIEYAPAPIDSEASNGV